MAGPEEVEETAAAEAPPPAAEGHDSPGPGPEKEAEDAGGEGNGGGGADERKSKRSRSRSRSRSRVRKSSRRSRSRSRERERSSRRRSRSRSRDKDRGRKSSRRSRSRSESPDAAARRRRRRERGSNWDKPPEGMPPGTVPIPAMGAAPPMAHGGLGVGLPGLGAGAPGAPGLGAGATVTVSSLEVNGLTAAVMMGQAPPPPGLTNGPLRGAIGTLTTPTAPANAQELFNGVLIPVNQIRQAKRLYIGNTPIGIDQVTLMSLFNQAMVAAGKGTPEEPPIVGVQVNETKPFAFIETRTPEDACNALLFDGLAIGGNVLKVRRPKDYRPLPGIVDPPVGQSLVPGAVPTTVSESENKIYLGSIPTHFNEMQVRELVSAFGELRAFNLVKDLATGNSRGFCFFEYTDTNLTDRVCQELNGFELGDRKLVCQRANTGPRGAALPNQMGMGDNPYAALMGMAGMGGLAAMGAAALAPLPPATRVLKLSNMVVADELKDDAEYEEIVTDIREECGKYGAVLSLKVPRPTWKDDGSIDFMPPAVGEVFVEFGDTDGANKAGLALRNRQFSGRTVTCSFLDEAKYDEGTLA